MIVNLFAGPGGMDMGARTLGLNTSTFGYDLDADACATATAAGFGRAMASVTDLDPEDFRGIVGALITPPCPPFSRGGLRKGINDFPAIRQALTLLGDYIADMVAEDAYRETLTNLHDARSALVVETLRFAFLMPDVRWIIAEQVPGVAPIWQEIGAELAAAADWTRLYVVSVAAEDLGVASCRTRTFLIATRDYVPDLTGLPTRSLWTTGRFVPPTLTLPTTGPAFSTMTMADALGWPTGERVNTRGNRYTSGGNVFSADRPSWCLTSKARSWKRVSDGAPLTSAQAGLLTGFPADYPWQGSRTKQFLQAADVVSPPVAAAVLGTALDIEWQRPVRDYLTSIYPAMPRRTSAVQPSLLDEMGVAV